MGDRRNWQSQSPKGATPLLKTSEASEASFCLGASPQKGGLTVAPFGISASRNRQSPPNCPKFSGSGYVQTVALGLGRDGVRTGAGKNLRFAGIEVLAKPIFVRGLPLQWRRHCRFHAPSGGRKNWLCQFFRRGQDPLFIVSAQNCGVILLTIVRSRIARCRSRSRRQPRLPVVYPSATSLFASASPDSCTISF